MENDKMKIMMVTMGLDIGGAETHIVELSKELKRRGYDIQIVSNGGVYVSEIEAAGIRHFSLPLNSRSLPAMMKSYKGLKKLIKSENPDVVHSHARIPAFILGLVRKTLKFNFITSAHGVFDTTGGLKYLTDWGQKTIAVSEDIKEYLVENYRVPGQNIKVTINGIDTEKFSAGTDCSDVRAEFGIGEDEPVICHVSRLDDETVMMAERMIKAMPSICEAVPRTRLVIAGGGTKEASLREAAAAVNAGLGREAVVMTGPRTDINKIVAMCDVFAGVSRTALEAMSCEKPVVLAGNQGYMGLFTAPKLREARADNFCCRSRGHHTNDDIAGELIAALEKRDTPEMEELGKFCREVILNYYSVKRMADDCIEVYNKAVKKPYHILMSGYYGFFNAGDDSILHSIHRNLLTYDENIQVQVLVANPKEAAKRCDYDIVNRFNPIGILRALKKCDMLISGGGSLLQDRTSTKSILYYIMIIRLAEKMKKNVVLYANGIGPVIKPQNRKRVRKAVQNATLITLRDTNSENELKSMGIDRNDIRVTADPVFTFRPNLYNQSSAREFLKNEGVPDDKPFVAVSLRNWMNMSGFQQKMADLCDSIYERHDVNIVFIGMQIPNDTVISKEVRARMKNPSYTLEKIYTTEQIMEMLSCAEMIISMRLHTLIYAAGVGVPALGIVYDPKVKYQLEALHMPSLGKIESFDTGRALIVIDEVINNLPHYREIIAEQAKVYYEKAKQNDVLLEKLIVSETEK